MTKATTPPDFLAASDPALGQLGDYSGQFKALSDSDIVTLLDMCRAMTWVAVGLMLPGLFIDNFIGTILVVAGGLFFLGPGLASRTLENERQTRARIASTETAMREEIRARQAMVSDLADQLLADERRQARERR